MSKQKNIFIIIDFGAKNVYTHHIPLIQRYSEIISENNDLLVLIPQYADKKAFKETKGEIKYLLTSPVYGPSLRQNPIQFLFYFILDRTLTALHKKSKISQKIKRIVKAKITKKPFKLILKLTKDYDLVNIVFPTTDTLSVELAKTLFSENLNDNLIISFRIVGSESRGKIASGNELKDIKLLSETFPGRIKVGWETYGYRDLLLQLKFQQKIIFWSPWPPLDLYTSRKNYKNKFLIGFLGTAKKRKGFDLIPSIIRELIPSGLNFLSIVQTTNFPWEGYTETIGELKNDLKDYCLLLPPILSLDDLKKYIKELSIMILPYNSESYSINASGILYHASDYHVPILTFKNVGFEFEILEYNLGYLFSEISEIPELLKRVNISEDDFGFERYNLSRIEANKVFFYNRP